MPSTPSTESQLGAIEPRPGTRIGAYEVLHRVARGGMATVLAVRDTRDGTMRAMKLLLPIAEAEEARTRFRREFRALSRLQHPNILRVFEWGLLDDRPWFTMELLEGQTLKDAVASWRDLPPGPRFERVEHVLIQIARALAYAHDRGLVHRDVTPGNIMVTESDDGPPTVKLMDFGVVKDLGTDLTHHGEVIGTVAYISPEQVVGDAVDARADLYSLGAVLYLMLTGRRPFSARTLHGYLEKHLHEAPRPPAEVEPLTPKHLDRICLRLLAKDPADRYASATHLLHVLGDRGDPIDPDRWPPRAVGRTLQTARLRDALDDLAQHGQGAALLLSGEPGMGKSRLLDSATTLARRLGLVVARGRCRAQDRPFGAFVGVYRALAGDVPPPILQQVLDTEDDGIVRERYPVIKAFRDLVVERAPCVIVLDDLENADPATAELLEYLVRNTLELSAEPVVFLLGQDASAHGSPAERRLADVDVVAHVPLPPLDAAEVEELVLSMLPNDAGSLALAQRLHEESGGSPAFIADMLQGLVDEGVLQPDGERWRLTLDPTEITRSRLPIPASIREAVRDRLTGLPADAIEVARVLATSRRRLDMDVLIDVTGLDEERVMEAIDLLEEARLVEERRDSDLERFELVEGRVRDVLLEALDSEDRRRRHQRLGEVLERHHRDRPGVLVEELAYQFEQAGLAPKAYAFLMQTARRHLQRSLHEETLAFTSRALRMEPEARPLMLLDHADATLAELHLARSVALFHLGQWAEALSSAREARDLATAVRDPRLQSRVYAELGNQLRNQGFTDEAERALRAALERADAAGDPTLRPMPLYHLGALIWARGDLQAAEEAWRDVVGSAQAAGDDRALGFGYNGLGILAVCSGATAQARSHLEQSAALFSELGMLDALAIARVNLVELYLSTGVLRKALGLAERTVAQAQEVAHPHGIALGLAYRAQVLLEVGRYDEAEQNATEALKRIRQLGQAEDELLALSVLARVALATGRPEEALDRLDALAPLLAAHDAEGIAPQARAWRATALAMTGRVNEAIALLEGTDPLARQWPHLRVRTDLAWARAWRSVGRDADAEQALRRALEVAEAHGYRFYQLAAHHDLVGVTRDETTRARHQRVGTALARSLAASLPREDAQTFLAERWPDLSGRAKG